MKRREFIRLGCAAAIAAGAEKLRPASARSLAAVCLPGTAQHPTMVSLEQEAAARAADFTLRIAPMMIELAPQVVLSSIGYNAKVPDR